MGRKKYSGLCVIFFCLFSLFSTCRLEGEEGNWESSAALGVNAARGNADSIFATFSFDAERNRAEDLLRNGILASYGEQDNDTVAKEIMVNSQYNRTITPKTFWTVSGSFEHNQVSDIDYRYTFAPGYGYYFIKEESRLLEVSGGLAYIGQKFTTGETDNYLSTQLSERYELKTANSRIWNSLLFLPNVSDFSEFILKGELGFEAGVNNRMGLRLMLRNIYDSSPAAGRTNNDLMLISMVTFKL